MAVWDRIDFLRITAKPLNFFVALTSKMAGDMNFCTLRGKMASEEPKGVNVYFVKG